MSRALITCKTLRYEEGVCWLYENSEPSKGLEETVEFTLKNLEIVGQEGNSTLEVSLEPGSEKFVICKTVERGDFSFGWKIAAKIVDAAQ